MTQSNLPVVRMGDDGRPKYSDAVRKRIIAGLRGGYSRQAAAGMAGVHRSTLYDWISKDPAWALEVEIAEDMAEARYTGTIRNAALVRGDAKAAVAWLERRRPLNWREKVSFDDAGLEPEELLAEALEGDKLDDEFYRIAQAALRRRDGQDDARAASGADGTEPGSEGAAGSSDPAS